MLMSCAVEDAARSIKGKRAIATEAFGRALRQIPVILADNAGYDSSDLVTKLRAAHYDGEADAGLGTFPSFSFFDFFFLIGHTYLRVVNSAFHFSDMDQGTIGSMKTLGVTESYKLKRQVVLSATEAAEMIIRYVLLLPSL